MEKRARKYECPDCGWSKDPTTHSNCGGVVVLDESVDEWVCNACGERMSGSITCPRCRRELDANGEHVRPTFVRI